MSRRGCSKSRGRGDRQRCRVPIVVNLSAASQPTPVWLVRRYSPRHEGGYLTFLGCQETRCFRFDV